MKRVGFRWLARGACRHPEAATIRGGSLCAVDFPALVGVIDHPERGTFLFDTGYDPAFLAATQAFPERLYRWTTPVTIGAELEWQAWLATNRIDAGKLAGTIVSHFHGDHVAGLAHMAHLPVFCARAGLESVRRGSRFARVRQGLLAELVPPQVDGQARFFEDLPTVPLPAEFAPFAEGQDLLGDGSLIALPLPGHCPGHWGLALRTEAGRFVLLAADAAWSGKAIAGDVPPPRLVTALLGETASYRRTLGLLNKAWHNGAGLAVLPSHCAATAGVIGADDAG